MCWFQQLTPRADTVSLKNTFVYKSQELFPRLRTDAKLFGPLLRFRTLLGDCQRPWRLFGMRTNEWEYIAAVKISENPGLGRKRFGFHLCFLTWNMGMHYIYCLPYRVIVNIQQENKCKSMPKKKKIKATQNNSDFWYAEHHHERGLLINPHNKMPALLCI